MGGKNSKSQVPNSKEAPNSKLQGSPGTGRAGRTEPERKRRRHGTRNDWNLGFGFSLELWTWNLEFPCPVPCSLNPRDILSLPSFHLRGANARSPERAQTAPVMSDVSTSCHGRVSRFNVPSSSARGAGALSVASFWPGITPPARAQSLSLRLAFHLRGANAIARGGAQTACVMIARSPGFSRWNAARHGTLRAQRQRQPPCACNSRLCFQASDQTHSGREASGLPLSEKQKAER